MSQNFGTVSMRTGTAHSLALKMPSSMSDSSVFTKENIHKSGAVSPRSDPKPVAYRRCPLQVISGRWGSIESAEQYFLLRSRQLLVPVYLSVLSKYMKAAKTHTKSDDAASALLDNQEDRQQYRMKLTKWAQGSLAAVQNSMFWLFMIVGSIARSPLTHFFAWVQKNSGNRLLQQLVTGKAAKFMNESKQLLHTFDHWFGEAVTEASASDIGPEQMELVRTLAFKLVLRSAGSFHLRVAMHTTRYPYKLLWLVHRAPGIRCSKRQNIAQEIMMSEPGELECNARKLKEICPDELGQIARDGRVPLHATSCGSRVWAIVNAMSTLLKGDSQLVEGINSLVRLIGQRCPSIDLQTMSSRIVTKKTLTRTLEGSSAKRWSIVAQEARPMLRGLTEAGVVYKDVLLDTDRFTQPGTVSMLTLDQSLKNKSFALVLPDASPTERRQWSSMFMRMIKANLDKVKRESRSVKEFAAVSACSITVFALRNVEGTRESFFAQVASCRSLIVGISLIRNEDGTLSVDCESELNFVTTMDLLMDAYTACTMVWNCLVIVVVILDHVMFHFCFVASPGSFLQQGSVQLAVARGRAPSASCTVQMLSSILRMQLKTLRFR